MADGRVCRVCGKAMPRWRGHNATCCSAACRKAVMREVHRRRRVGPPRTTPPRRPSGSTVRDYSTRFLAGDAMTAAEERRYQRTLAALRARRHRLDDAVAWQQRGDYAAHVQRCGPDMEGLWAGSDRDKRQQAAKARKEAA